jgi:HSP20 family molecular chaperone IbpA
MLVAIFFSKFSEYSFQDFDPEDLDIQVEGEMLIIKGEREVQRGNSFSKRHFNQRVSLQIAES